jgi:hypothetical protein
MKEVVRPSLWSDFDGTAVKVLSKADPRNWAKYPIPKIDGYFNFLYGVRSMGVDVAGIVSRRPDILPRRIVTARSIAKLGLREFFKSPEQIVLTGSEAKKGAFVAEKSKATTVGLIDDKPHRVGPEILNKLLEEEPDERQPLSEQARRVALGVVSHPKSTEYTERFIDGVREQTDETGIKVVERSNDHVFFLHGPNYGFELSVVQLEPYSMYAGDVFATHLQDFGTVLPKN